MSGRLLNLHWREKTSVHSLNAKPLVCEVISLFHCLCYVTWFYLRPESHFALEYQLDTENGMTLEWPEMSFYRECSPEGGRSLSRFRYYGLWCSGRALIEDVRDPLDSAWVASIVPLRSPTDDPIRRGFQPSVLSALASLRVPYLYRSCSWFALLTWVSVFACHSTSEPITLSFTRVVFIDSCTAAASNGAW